MPAVSIALFQSVWLKLQLSYFGCGFPCFLTRGGKIWRFMTLLNICFIFFLPSTPLFHFQSLRLYFLGKETMEQKEEDSLATWHTGGGPCWHCTHCWHSHPCHDYWHPSVCGKKGRVLEQSPIGVGSIVRYYSISETEHWPTQFLSFLWQNCAVNVMRAEGFYCLSCIYQFLISPYFLTYLKILFTSVSLGYIAIHSLSCQL